MEIKGKRFIVIGGAGFIGSHVVSELLKHEVKEVVIEEVIVAVREEIGRAHV